MKHVLLLLILVSGTTVYGQSAKKLNRILRAELAVEQQKQDSAYAVFLKSVTAVSQAKNRTDKKSEALSQQARALRQNQISIRETIKTLGKLDQHPDMSGVANYMDLPGARDVIRPIKDLGKKIESFEKVPDQIELDGLKRKQQNELMKVKLTQYREFAQANTLRLERNEGKKKLLELALPRLDSVISVYETADSVLHLKRKELDKQFETLRENYRLKGPKGFSSAYATVFPDVHPEEIHEQRGYEFPSTNKVVEEKESEIYEFVDESPEYPGGMSALMQYLSENLKYPQFAAENGIEGKVLIRFVVTANGSVSNVTVVKGVSGCRECDQEAIRVVKKMPKWAPGKMNGKTVGCYFTLPIQFALN